MSHGTRTNVLVAIALLAVVFASYGSALGNGLVSDDFLLFIGLVAFGAYLWLVARPGLLRHARRPVTVAD